MKAILIRSILVVAFLFGTVGLSSASAGNPFSGETTTAGGYPTWDSDMINIEGVSQTGAGVYVAVLDTGMVPNWHDYFPEERVNTALGTGFDQPVSFKAKKDDRVGWASKSGSSTRPPGLGPPARRMARMSPAQSWATSTGATQDAAAGFPLPPIMVRGIAPDVTIIPVKVLADYQVPATTQMSRSNASLKERYLAPMQWWQRASIMSPIWRSLVTSRW